MTTTASTKLKRIREVVALEGLRLHLTLDDGSVVERDVSHLLVGPIFEELRDNPARFRQARVENGTVVWPNGADLCPDVLIWGGPPPRSEPLRTSNSADTGKRKGQVAEPSGRYRPGIYRPRSSREKGADLEDEVERMLRASGFELQRSKWFTTPFGRWEVDIFVPGAPPAVIECKNPTAEARSPAASIQRKTQEAFFKLYLLQRYCPDLPPDTRFFLILGDLPLQVDSKQFGRRDYEKFLRLTLGPSLRIVPRSELRQLVELLARTT